MSDYPRTIEFDGEVYQTRHLVARVDATPDTDPYRYPAELDLPTRVKDALVDMAVRRRHGRAATLHHSRLDSWAMDGSLSRHQLTVQVGPTRYGATPVRDMWLTVRRSEIADAVAAYTAYTGRTVTES